ncbi:DC1 [Arabidopsis thaliana x Arabidopsis arenosa]|uniref:DC1 n=1 Tax=Arabidopsis thaliana x Arabidopsis arenosa TaxID=1240361 RepID=A0A8T2ERU3_9BRAS|nr:DC1 [Arabidopsis thaliana x Arabidopsis arenosa]
MDPEVKFILLIVSFNGFKSDMNADTERVISLITQTISLVKSKMTETETETELMSLISETIVCFKEMDLESQPMPLRMLISLLSGTPFVNSSDWDWDEPVPDSMLMPLIRDTWSIKPQPELISLIQKIISLVDNSPELKLKSFINQLIFLDDNLSQRRDWNYPLKFLSLSRYIISQATSVDWNLQPKPESELISLTNQSVSVFNSMDVDSQPEPLRKLISLASSRFPSPNSRDSWKQNRDILDFFKDKKVEFTAKNVSEFLDKKIFLMIAEILSLETEPKLISLIHRIFSLVMSMNSTSKTFISLCPQVQVILKEGKFHVIEQGLWSRNQKWDDLLSDDDSTEAREVSWRKNKWDCLPFNWEKFILPKEEGTHFLCRGCYGENHEDNSKAPVEIKHPLHPKHSLQLALFNDDKTRQCYCCHELLRDDTASMFYFCSPCDFGLKFTCAKKSPVLSIDQPKWHKHTLALFPSLDPQTCSLCALKHSNLLFYICPPCYFIAHQSCFSLPHVIRISRHLHFIFFTHSFPKGDWICGICRRKINNDYGGYHCIKKGCLYAVHSKCATQPNVWDGIEREGESEEEVEELEPFVTISDGIIQHFSHEDHHLTLDENNGKDYDENKLCQACIMPIYFGNSYSCLQCDFILHEECANLSRRLHHPIHPHLLTLISDNPLRDVGSWNNSDRDYCSACPSLCIAGFFYKCSKIDCDFRLHVQCATISEPLLHPSHMHHLFLTSKPNEERNCSVCAKAPGEYTKETFNCIEEECDYALCFKCATLPQQVRYKHDKHILPLSYGKKTSSMTYWCEACEGKINPEEGFYRCDEYCCVHLHITCLLGKDLYLKPRSSWSLSCGALLILPNYLWMSRPICSSCGNRCPQRIFLFLLSGASFFCSVYCIPTTRELGFFPGLEAGELALILSSFRS